MKHISGVILIGITIFLTSCKEEQVNTMTNENTSKIIQDGSWNVTYFFQTNTNSTSDFTGYDFSFGSNNTVTAFDGSNIVTGTWATGTDKDDPKLILVFSGFSSPFDQLSNDWKVIELTTTKLRLDDESGANGDTDYLTFERN
jgi:hypothetical protein